jgi:hypothetical protein
MAELEFDEVLELTLVDAIFFSLEESVNATNTLTISLNASFVPFLKWVIDDHHAF